MSNILQSNHVTAHKWFRFFSSAIAPGISVIQARLLLDRFERQRVGDLLILALRLVVHRDECRCLSTWTAAQCCSCICYFCWAALLLVSLKLFLDPLRLSQIDPLRLLLGSGRLGVLVVLRAAARWGGRSRFPLPAVCLCHSWRRLLLSPLLHGIAGSEKLPFKLSNSACQELQLLPHGRSGGSHLVHLVLQCIFPSLRSASFNSIGKDCSICHFLCPCQLARWPSQW